MYINVRERLFELAIVKGLVEHNDATAYFGSLMNFLEYANTACREGWIDKQPGRTYVLLPLGEKVYKASGIEVFPKEFLTRAFTWELDQIPEDFEVEP